MISARVAEYFPDRTEGLIWAFRVVLWWSIFGIIFILLAWMTVSSYKSFEDEDKEEDEPKLVNLDLEVLK